MRHFEQQNVEYFLNEISDLGVKDPSLVALGTPTFDILNRNLSDRYKIINATTLLEKIKRSIGTMLRKYVLNICKNVSPVFPLCFPTEGYTLRINRQNMTF